ncbi:uncharacterized protein RMCC_2193 [Mycolicibacterium canariasense]|uniref:Uncharacterized protein n=1 Tax=Mycolicibacterium canariasense TaxID=228230 RepID=A0A100WB38_MYCCR|nr:uncharacterized protein RMCC_2193 [Mycolicibacterium canariasense]
MSAYAGAANSAAANAATANTADNFISPAQPVADELETRPPGNVDNGPTVHNCSGKSTCVHGVNCYPQLTSVG